MSAPERVAVVDAGPCGGCGCGQWDHRQGKKGCKDPGCGCGKYEPPKGAPANDWPLPVAEVEQAEAAGLVVRPESPAADPALAGARAELEPAGPVPVVVADPAARAAYVEQVAADRPMPPADFLAAHTMVGERAAAGYGWQEGYLAGHAASAAERDEARRTRDGFEVQRDQAYERVDELVAELGRTEATRQRLAQLLDKTAAALADERAEHLNAVGRLRAELDRVNADRQRAQDALDEAEWTGPQASLVLWRYDADQCTTEACGSRYTVPTQHPHPLTPVTVLVVRREVAR